MQYGRLVTLVSNILKHFAILSLQALFHHYLAIILTYDFKKRLNKESRVWQEIAQDVAIVKQIIATSSFSFLIALPELSHHFSGRYIKEVWRYHLCSHFFSFHGTQLRIHNFLSSSIKLTEEDISQLLDESEDKCKGTESSSLESGNDRDCTIYF